MKFRVKELTALIDGILAITLITSSAQGVPPYYAGYAYFGSAGGPYVTPPVQSLRDLITSSRQDAVADEKN
jgi:hypothetical protein